MTFSSVTHNAPQLVGATTMAAASVDLKRLESILEDIGRVIKMKDVPQAEMPEIIVNVAAPQVNVEQPESPVVNLESPVYVTQPAVTVNLNPRPIFYASLLPTIAILADIAVRIFLK